MYSVDFIVPAAPGMNTARHPTWKQTSRENKKWRHMIGILARVEGPLPPKPLRCALVTVTRISMTMPDGDNLYQGTMKVVLDALQYHRIISDDGPECIGMPRAQWQKFKSTKMLTRVEVHECDPLDLDISHWNPEPYDDTLT